MLDHHSAIADYEAERRLVGALLLSPTDTLRVISRVSTNDFWFNNCGLTFAAIAELAMSSSPITFETVARKLQTMSTGPMGRNASEDVGGVAGLAAFVEGVDASEIDFWVDRVISAAERRILLDFVKRAERRVLDETADVSKIRTDLEESLIGARRDSSVANTTITMHQAVEAFQERLQRYIDNPDAITGHATGWEAFDRVLDGLQPGNVTIVYAPSSRFKSLFAANIGWLLSRNGAKGIWFTTEMPSIQVTERVLQLEAGLNIRWLRRDGTIWKYKTQLINAQNRIANYGILICDSVVDIGQLKSEVLRRKRWDGLDYVIVDLVDMVSTSQYKDDSISQQSAIMRQMKELAKAASVHIILASHVSKGDRSLRNKPDLDVEEMKGSSSKYQDVDVAISLMPVGRDQETGQWYGLTRDQIMQRLREKGELITMVAITKNRHGELDKLPFKLDWNCGGRMWPLSGSNTSFNLDDALQQQLNEEIEEFSEER